MNTNREPPEKWNRVLTAAKASRTGKITSTESAPPADFSTTLLGRLRAFHASLAVWQRWSLLAGLVSILLFIASFIYLKSTAPEQDAPLIEMPSLDLPQPPSSPHP